MTLVGHQEKYGDKKSSECKIQIDLNFENDLFVRWDFKTWGEQNGR